MQNRRQMASSLKAVNADIIAIFRLIGGVRVCVYQFPPQTLFRRDKDAQFPS